MIKVRVNNRSQQADRSSINAIAAAQAWAGETGRIESGVWGWAPSRKEFVERFPVVTLESKMGLTPNRHGHIMYGLKNPLRSLPSTSVQPQLVNAPARIQDFAACHSAQCSGSFGLSGAFLDEQAAAKNQAGWDRYCKKGLDRKERSRNFDLAKAGREGDRTVSAALRQEKRMLLLDEDELAAVESLLYPGAAKAAKALKAAEKKLNGSFKGASGKRQTFGSFVLQAHSGPGIGTPDWAAGATPTAGAAPTNGAGATTGAATS